MLTALRIQSFAIIDELEVRFGPGFNVLTGETGAGKSILVDALHLVLGGRASLDVIRTGAEEATVEALFEGDEIASRLKDLGLPTGDGGELLVRRVVQRNGRGRAYVNGTLATVGLLEQVTRGLVDISGQHEHVSLLNTELHLALLDGYAGLQAEAARYREAWEQLQAALRERDGLALDDAERARRTDYLAFQIEEIERVDPSPGEDEALALERKRLASAGKLRELAEEAERALYSGEQSATDVIGSAVTRLTDAAALDPSLNALVSGLRSALVEVEEAARALGSYARSIESDPGRLVEVEERLEALKRLCRKHGGDVASVLKRRDSMREELAGIARHAERLEELGRACEERGAHALALARALSTRRQKAASRFARAVEAELERLAMGKTVFRVALRSDGAADEEGATAFDGVRLGPRGLDRCELLLSPNPGEQVKPLDRIASGGELSRVMLAIKRVLARTDPVPTYVFDEVDAGIGGAVAEVVGRLLREVARERQVICITHLPQIAVHASQHYSVEKQVRDGRTVSRILPLSESARVAEIARMLAGVEVTAAALKNAESMLEASRKREAEAGRARK